MNKLNKIYSFLSEGERKVIVKGSKELNYVNEYKKDFNKGDIVIVLDSMLNESEKSLYTVVDKSQRPNDDFYIIESNTGVKSKVSPESIMKVDEGVLGSIAKMGVKAIGKTISLAGKPTGWLLKKTGGAVAQHVKHKYTSRIPSINSLMGSNVSKPKFKLFNKPAPFYSGFNKKGNKIGAKKKMLVIRGSMLLSRVPLEDQNAIVRAVKGVEEHLDSILFQKNYTAKTEMDLMNIEKEESVKTVNVDTNASADSRQQVRQQVVNDSFYYTDAMKKHMLIKEENISYKNLSKEFEGSGKETSLDVKKTKESRKHAVTFHKTEYVILKEEESTRENRKFFWFRVNMSIFIIPTYDGKYMLHVTDKNNPKGKAFLFSDEGKSPDDKDKLTYAKNIMIEAFNTMASEFVTL